MTNIGYSQEGEEKKKSKIVRPVFSVFTTGSFIVDSGELGTVASPLVSGGIELYLGIPKIYLYTSLLYTHSLVIQDIYNYGSALNVKFGLGGHVYSNYTPSKDKWWSLAMNGGGLFTLTAQKSNVFDGTFNSQKHRIFFHFGAFVNLRAFYHFHKDVALMFGYDLTWYVYPELKSFENGFTIGFAF
ncbi:MAG: hypothetical protein ACRCTQ_02895 [Brevinemataceae bacterium]